MDKTIYGLSVETQWEKILELHVLKLAKEYRLDWYRWRLENNYERAVFLKGDPIKPCETTRYLWANKNLYGKKILEIGCSTGYGIQFLPSDIAYTGVDYDEIIIQVAREQLWNENSIFYNADINTYPLNHYTTIIAFEIIEHLDNGLEIVEKLKQHCNRLLLTVPHNEPKGFWGSHHKLHGLNESNFPGFKFQYINEKGYLSDTPAEVNDINHYNLMLCRWDNE